MPEISKKSQHQITAIEKELAMLPNGSLIKKKSFYYHKLDGKETGITNNPVLIQQLARQRFLNQEKKLIQKNIIANPNEIMNMLPKSYQDLPVANFYHTRVHQWLAKPEVKNTYPMTTIYTTKNGTQVRSKSEWMVANVLEKHQIPYRYENRMVIAGQKMHPDFMLMQPFTGKLILWEHFGALNREGYEEKMILKMNTLLGNGWRPWDNLIYTFEFDLNHIERLIETFILG